MLPAGRFTSDGCTWAPDTIGTVNLRSICVAHDYRYWLGGTEEEKLEADEELRDEIRAKGLFLTAAVYYRFVRAFGGRHWPASPMPNRHHWGYGWPKDDYGAGYAA